jgi:hypothetical protein
MAAVVEPEPDDVTLTALPLPLVLHVFSLLPPDARARAACVCRDWRSALEEPSLWTRLDLSASSGVRVRVRDAVLRGAARKARGQLAALDVSDCVRVSFDALLSVVSANGGALRELCVGVREYGMPQTLNADRVERLLQAAPQLTACHADVPCRSSVAVARRMLRNEPPFQPLRLRALGIDFQGEADADDASAVLALAADMAAHASLKRVCLCETSMLSLAALNAVLDAARACQLVSLTFWDFRVSPASARALVRLLGSGALTELTIHDMYWEPLLDGPTAALLGDALRANSTLTSLSLHEMDLDLWHDAAAVLLGALTGHSSLRTLAFSNSEAAEAHAAAAGAALGALVAANAPALTELDVSYCCVGDAGLRPLFDALPSNTHLRTLNVLDTDMSEAFARNVLLPALSANTSLRTLHAFDTCWGAPARPR